MGLGARNRGRFDLPRRLPNTSSGSGGVSSLQFIDIPVSDGQTSLVVSAIPTVPADAYLFINGIDYFSPADYSIQTDTPSPGFSTLNLTLIFTLKSTDVVRFYY